MKEALSRSSRVITDVALDPFTTHGQDGIIDDEGYVLNDVTVDMPWCGRRLSHAEAGADMVAPSDMMDGRIGAIRAIARGERPRRTRASWRIPRNTPPVIYGPFRDAVGSAGNLGGGNKNSYQMAPSGNTDEALARSEPWTFRGGRRRRTWSSRRMPYLDIVRRVKAELQACPTFAYQVSGEYAMLKAAAQNNWLDERSAVLEALLCIRRAGASAILTYYAVEAARWLRDD